MVTALVLSSLGKLYYTHKRDLSLPIYTFIAMSSPAASEVNTNVNEALVTLSNLWQKMLQIIQAVSATSASSLTVEPDLVALQKIRKEYEQLMTSLKTTAAWLKANELQTPADESMATDDLERLLVEQDELKKVYFT